MAECWGVGMPAAFPVFFTCLKAVLSKMHMNLGLDFSGERRCSLVSAKTWDFFLYAHVLGSLSLRTPRLWGQIWADVLCPVEQAALLLPFSVVFSKWHWRGGKFPVCPGLPSELCDAQRMHCCCHGKHLTSWAWAGLALFLLICFPQYLLF